MTLFYTSHLSTYLLTHTHNLNNFIRAVPNFENYPVSDTWTNEIQLEFSSMLFTRSGYPVVEQFTGYNPNLYDAVFYKVGENRKKFVKVNGRIIYGLITSIYQRSVYIDTSA